LLQLHLQQIDAIGAAIGSSASARQGRRSTTSTRLILLAGLDRLWIGVPCYKPLSVGVVLLDLVPWPRRTSDRRADQRCARDAVPKLAVIGGGAPLGGGDLAISEQPIEPGEDPPKWRSSTRGASGTDRDRVREGAFRRGP
jgi:hypothetical protein